jgi:hypothetical protein
VSHARVRCALCVVRCAWLVARVRRSAERGAASPVYHARWPPRSKIQEAGSARDAGVVEARIRACALIVYHLATTAGASASLSAFREGDRGEIQWEILRATFRTCSAHAVIAAWTQARLKGFAARAWRGTRGRRTRSRVTHKISMGPARLVAIVFVVGECGCAVGTAFCGIVAPSACGRGGRGGGQRMTLQEISCVLRSKLVGFATHFTNSSTCDDGCKIASPATRHLSEMHKVVATTLTWFEIVPTSEHGANNTSHP